ncbi:unnamed protein product [Callosobruchus maculatus]|uniref:Uncharacterized protein n=1 Tax=Callosobruchus maculatus TaxID=64391 RepID=A0A653D283_CALMS|nr:unnamed protein product [Callosobruchus maculatus]
MKSLDFLLSSRHHRFIRQSERKLGQLQRTSSVNSYTSRTLDIKSTKWFTALQQFLCLSKSLSGTPKSSERTSENRI